jgi:hypothetical protein
MCAEFMKMNYFRVQYNNTKEVLTGREVSALQQSGCAVKVLRKATKEEHDKQKEAKGEM